MNRQDRNTWIRKMVPSIVTSVIVALMLFAFRVWALPTASTGPNVSPGVISYQGNLIDEGGEPVHGNIDMTFRLYNVPTGGTALWTEAHTGQNNAVPVQNGLFNVLLGSLTPIPADVWSNAAVYLEMEVGGETLAPRETVGAVPYALYASFSDRAFVLSAPDGDPADAVYVDDSGWVGIGTTSPDRPLTVKGIGGDTEWISFMDGNGDVPWYLNYRNGGLNFAEPGEADGRLYLQDGGNVGIGTYTPTVTLDVNGDIDWSGDLRGFSWEWFSAARGDQAGTTSSPMTDPFHSICFLTMVAMEEIDTGGEAASCHIVWEEGQWVLLAILGAGGGPDANVWCEAVCLKW